MVHEPAYLRCACRRQGTGQSPGAGVGPPTVGEWLQEWLAGKKKLRAATVRSYEGHIRLYLIPCIGDIPLDRLRVTDVASVFDYIDDLNDAVTRVRASGDPALREAVKGRHLVGSATCQRIRATLRSAIGTYMRQQPGALPVNVAAIVELPPSPRPRGLVWTDERVRVWQQGFNAPARRRPCRGRAGRPGLHLGLRSAAVAGHGLDPDTDHGVPRSGQQAPAACPVAAFRSPGLAPR